MRQPTATEVREMATREDPRLAKMSEVLDEIAFAFLDATLMVGSTKDGSIKWLQLGPKHPDQEFMRRLVDDKPLTARDIREARKRCQRRFEELMSDNRSNLDRAKYVSEGSDPRVPYIFGPKAVNINKPVRSKAQELWDSIPNN